MKHFKSLLAAGIIATIPLSASALGISVQTFAVTGPGGLGQPAALAAARGAYAAELAKFVTYTVETFEGNASQEVAPTTSLSTDVGDFATTGSTGAGTSQIGTGTNIATRNDGDGSSLGATNSGRFNTTVGGSGYLDSNDTTGIEWSIPGSVSGGLGMFDRLLFNLVDVADQRKTLSINATDENGVMSTSLYTISGQTDATINTVLISFDSRVASAIVTLKNNGVNDGFSIDDATIGAVPLPAAAWLLLGVSGALVAAKRRRARRAA